MKIKVGDKIYDAEDERIMVILSDWDKENITNMLPECHKYASWPEGTFTPEEISEWMGDPV